MVQTRHHIWIERCQQICKISFRYIHIILSSNTKTSFYRAIYLRPRSLKSFSSAISKFSRLTNDTVEGYCSLLASISFNSNRMSYTFNKARMKHKKLSVSNKNSYQHLKEFIFAYRTYKYWYGIASKICVRANYLTSQDNEWERERWRRAIKKATKTSFQVKVLFNIILWWKEKVYLVLRGQTYHLVNLSLDARTIFVNDEIKTRCNIFLCYVVDNDIKKIDWFQLK